MNNQKINILLVEDNPGDARLIKEMLLHAGARQFRLDSAECLENAFDRLRSGGHDLMLLDLHLPDSQGLETFHRAKAQTPDTPIIILTGLADEAIGIKAVEQGAQDFLIKGETSEALLKRSILYALERKSSEESLRASERRYRGLFDGMLDSCALLEIVLDPEGQPVDAVNLEVNATYEQTFNRRREETIGRRWSELLPELDTEWYAMCGRVALTGEPVKTKQHLKSLGKTFEVSIYSPEKGKFAVIRGDVTERERAVENLRLTEERLEMAIHGADLGLWDCDIPTSQVTLNERGAEIAGYSPSEVISDLKTLSGQVNPDDLGKLRRRVQEHLQGNIPFFETETRIRTKAGEWRWLMIRGRVVERDGQGKPSRAAGIHRDITEQKQSGEALRESEERYRTIVETAAEGIWVVDAEGVTTFVNEQLADMLGYGLEQMIGRPIFDFMDQEGQAVARGHLDRRRMGIKEQYDFKYRAADGVDFWAIVSATPLFDDQGNYVGAMKMVTDINERKKGEIREKARFALLNKLQSAKSVEECLNLGCKAIYESRLFDRSAFMLLNADGGITDFGQHGLEKTDVNAIKKAQTVDRELMTKIMQPKFRISRSYFLNQKDVPNAVDLFPIISTRTDGEESAWKAGDIFIVPVLQGAEEKLEGVLSVALPYTVRRPPPYDFVLRLEEIVDMVTIRVRELRQTETLNHERQTLAEKNVALKEIMSSIEAEKMEIRQQIAATIDQVLKPAVNRLTRRDGTVNKTYFDLLKYNLDELAASTGGTLHISSKLSPREMEICAMIKNGSSSKDIAEALDIALVTVQKHREVIRRKLGLTNKNVNLTTHLRNM
jgi:PAS domain S-box-containing protein